MNGKVLIKDYDKFNIPIEKIPSYDNDPKKLMDRYKKCSILTYGKITYSDSTAENAKNLPVGEEN